MAIATPPKKITKPSEPKKTAGNAARSASRSGRYIPHRTSAKHPPATSQMAAARNVAAAGDQNAMFTVDRLIDEPRLPEHDDDREEVRNEESWKAFPSLVAVHAGGVSSGTSRPA